MEITDLPNIIATMNDPKKIEQISYIIDCCNQGYITYNEADQQIDEIIKSKRAVVN